MELERRPSGVQRGSSNAKIPHFLRLTVYSYLPLKTLITKIAILNQQEKRTLYNSAIVRENKTFYCSMQHDKWHWLEV